MALARASRRAVSIANSLDFASWRTALITVSTKGVIAETRAGIVASILSAKASVVALLLGFAGRFSGRKWLGWQMASGLVF